MQHGRVVKKERKTQDFRQSERKKKGKEKENSFDSYRERKKGKENRKQKKFDSQKEKEKRQSKQSKTGMIKNNDGLAITRRKRENAKKTNRQDTIEWRSRENKKEEEVVQKEEDIGENMVSVRQGGITNTFARQAIFQVCSK